LKAFRASLSGETFFFNSKTANIPSDSPNKNESKNMALKPYASISKIAALCARAGYVVGVEDGKTVIETGAEKITFCTDRTITNDAGENIDMDAAIKLLKIKL
jgi:hypothetical protein